MLLADFPTQPWCFFLHHVLTCAVVQALQKAYTLHILTFSQGKSKLDSSFCNIFRRSAYNIALNITPVASITETEGVHMCLVPCVWYHEWYNGTMKDDLPSHVTVNYST